jgi:membrane protein
MPLKTTGTLIRRTIGRWSEDRISRLSAALAFYTLFAIAPMLVIVIAIAGLVFEPHEVRGRVVQEIGHLVGTEGARTIETAVERASDPDAGIMALVVSIAMLLVLSTGLFVEMQDALNKLWGVEPRPDAGYMSLIWSRLLSFGMILAIGFLLMVSLVASAVLSVLSGYFQGLLPGVDWLWLIVHEIVSLAVFTVLFALIFRVLPDARLSWRAIWLGAIVTAVLFTIGKFLIGLYLGRAAVGEVYGAAGSLVVILLWVYYSAQILFTGAAFTRVYAEHRGHGPVPKEQAKPREQGED